MRTSNVVLLAEIDILESRIGIDANELETVKEFNRMADEIAALKGALVDMVDGCDTYDLVCHTGLSKDRCKEIIGLALNK